jgi:hypothetical protein
MRAHDSRRASLSGDGHRKNNRRCLDFARDDRPRGQGHTSMRSSALRSSAGSTSYYSRARSLGVRACAHMTPAAPAYRATGIARTTADPSTSLGMTGPGGQGHTSMRSSTLRSSAGSTSYYSRARSWAFVHARSRQAADPAMGIARATADPSASLGMTVPGECGAC